MHYRAGGECEHEQEFCLRTAFWAGLASPASIYKDVVVYRPWVSDLTFADSFALVGLFLSNAMIEADAGQRVFEHATDGEQLSFEFGQGGVASVSNHSDHHPG